MKRYQDLSHLLRRASERVAATRDFDLHAAMHNNGQMNLTTVEQMASILGWQDDFRKLKSASAKGKEQGPKGTIRYPLGKQRRAMNMMVGASFRVRCNSISLYAASLSAEGVSNCSGCCRGNRRHGR